MREMVLNHASVSVKDKFTALSYLKDVAQAISGLYLQHVVINELKMVRHAHEIRCVEGLDFHEAILELRKSGSLEEYRFMIRMILKAPLKDILSPTVKDRFQSCEATGVASKQLSPEDGAPLLYCAIADGIAVGFPSDPVWEQDQMVVYFAELSPDGDELGETAESIDNLTRPEHADAISERHRANMRDVSNFGELWARRSEIFPNLLFGPDVESQLERINPSALSAITKKLSMLDGDSAKWRTADTTMPEWSCRVRPESNSVRNNPSLIEARCFRSSNGNTEIFEWHADFGYDRIHLRFDAQTKEVEIGYIGQHLPL